MTEFIVPKGFAADSVACGSAIHCPSTTNRYSWVPGGNASWPLHRPSASRSSGVARGFQSLKVPAKNTSCASSRHKAKQTCWLSTCALAFGVRVLFMFDFLFSVYSLTHFARKELHSGVSDSGLKESPRASTGAAAGPLAR